VVVSCQLLTPSRFTSLGSSPDIHQLEICVTQTTDLDALERGGWRKGNNLLPLVGMEPSSLVSAVCSLPTISAWLSRSHYYYYYYYYYYRISHCSPLAGKYSPILVFSNQQDQARWSYL
jgi:hypothetical protein